MFGEDSISYLREAVLKRKVTRGPLDVQILPTTRCNAACSFCPQYAVREDLIARHAPRWAEPPSDLHGGLMDRLYDEFYRLGGLKRVHFTGGEPLLIRHLVPLLFELKRSIPAAEVTVVTNGLLLEKQAPALVMVGLDRLSVSINAGSQESFEVINPRADQGAFERIIKGINTVSKIKHSMKTDKPYISATAVLTRHVVSEVEELYKLCLDAGANGLTFIPLMEFEFGGVAANQGLLPSEDQFNNFQDELRKLEASAQKNGFYLGYGGDPEFQGALRHHDLYSNIPCYSGYTFAMIWPNGDVRPCCNCEEVLGNIKENSFSQIWLSERYQEYRDRLLAIPKLGPPAGCDCRECGYVYENKMFHEMINKNG